MEHGFKQSQLAQDIRAFHCPRWAELPAIALYMDQVTGYINEVFAPIAPQDQEKMLTKAMVNNYVKLRVMQAPEKKKYHRAHMAYLVTICVLKQVFSLPEIGQMIQVQINHCPVEQAYDRFCEELEQAFARMFEQQVQPQHHHPGSELDLLRCAVQACAKKVYAQKQLAYNQQAEQMQEVQQ